MAYKVIILYRLYMPSYFLGTFTEYPYLIINVLIYFYIIIRLHTYCKSENNKSSLPSKTKASLLCTNSTAAIGSVISNAAI